MKLDQFIKKAIVDVARGIQEAKQEYGDSVRFIPSYSDTRVINKLHFNLMVSAIGDDLEVLIEKYVDTGAVRTISFSIPFKTPNK